jgi:RNA polymerase sigma-70 factor (ECF subfamily)
MRTFREALCFVLGLFLVTSTASSEAGGAPGWSPAQAVGKPNTLVAGDKESAWASLQPNNGSEWLKLEYANPVEIQTIRIRENYNPGAITKVSAFTEDGTESAIWEGDEPLKEAPNSFEILADSTVKSQSLKIYLDTTRVRGWNEIDAVQLVGKDGSEQWAIAASASSTYASKFERTVASLPPVVVKTIPQAGDMAVDPSLDKISVTFSKDMITKRMWSFSQISDDTFPKIPEGKEIGYLGDNRTCVMPVKLEPNKTYVIWINSPRFNAFRDIDNHSSVPYQLVFKTK